MVDTDDPEYLRKIIADIRTAMDHQRVIIESLELVIDYLLSEENINDITGCAGVPTKSNV